MPERPKSPGESPLPPPVQGAPFALVIAARHDPAEARGEHPHHISAVERTAILDVSGAFSAEGASAIAEEVDRQFAVDCTACIVRLRLDSVDDAALKRLASWIGARLDAGCDVRLSADQPDVWEAFAAVPELRRALVPIGDTSVSGHRKRVAAGPADG